MDPSGVSVRAAALAALDAVTLYQILALRVDVFVVEQNCVYRELDGRDLEPATRLVWVERAGAVLATLRVLREDDGAARIGRVVTAQPARGAGLAALLVQHALGINVGRPVVLDAQSHLAGWYERFGFVRDGADFVEDGIPHTPMRRPA